MIPNQTLPAHQRHLVRSRNYEPVISFILDGHTRGERKNGKLKKEERNR
jgi:hypothetical protein